jgi:hypothetical protein
MIRRRSITLSRILLFLDLSNADSSKTLRCANDSFGNGPRVDPEMERFDALQKSARRHPKN